MFSTRTGTPGLHPPIEWHDDVSTPIAITQPQIEDSLEDRFREALRSGRNGLRAILRELVDEEVAAARIDTIHALIAEIIESKDPRKKAIYLAIAAGMPIGLTKTLKEWADVLGVRKQCVQQGVEDVRARYRLRKNRLMRDEEARDHMRLANFHPTERHEDE